MNASARLTAADLARIEDESGEVDPLDTIRRLVAEIRALTAPCPATFQEQGREWVYLCALTGPHPAHVATHYTMASGGPLHPTSHGPRVWPAEPDEVSA